MIPTWLLWIVFSVLVMLAVSLRRALAKRPKADRRRQERP